MSTKLKPRDDPGTWEQPTVYERVDACRAMLFLHGFMTPAQNEAVKKKMWKWWTKTETGRPYEKK